MLKLDSLTVMHDEIRDGEKLTQMVDYIRGGGRWTKEAIHQYAAVSGDREEPIYITRFEDQSLYVHDGHRRITATHLGGRDFLFPEEYILENWKFADYLAIKWSINYITPHDPRTEIRLPEFFAFKKRVLKLKEDFSVEGAERYVLANKAKYCRPRTIWKVSELAERALRCIVTNNFCGTDTWTTEYVCPCHSCQLWMAWWQTEERKKVV